MCTLVVGLPIWDDEARVVSHLAEARGEDGGDVVEGLEGGQELVAALVVKNYNGGENENKEEDLNKEFDGDDLTWA